MRASLTAVAGLVAAVVCPPPALAQDGGGLYTPFPAPPTEGPAVQFVRELPGGRAELAELGIEDLRAGVVLDGAAPSSAREASARAGETGLGGAPSLAWPVEALLLTVGLAAGGLALVRRT
jgi:hypothetical protein